MRNLTVAIIAGLSVFVLAVSSAGSVSAAEISMSSLLDDMTNLSKMAEFPDPPFVAKQFSSYDRASTSPADQKTWFANNDCGNYLRVEEKNGHKEYVMADMAGPGAITRIWSPNPGGTMRIYLDGNEKPTLEYAMADLLGGKHPLLPPPIACELSRGWNLYFPIPYAKSCKVTCDQGGQYYHVGYRTYPKGTEVKTFTMEQLKHEQAAIAQEARRLEERRPKPDSWAQLKPFPKFIIQPNSSEVIAKFSGAKAVWLLCADVDLPVNQLEAALRATVIQIRFDGRQTVESPLGDFFGSAPGINQFRSLPFARVLESLNV